MQIILDGLNNIERSFKLALKGEEDLKIMIRWWGFLAYVIFYLGVDKLIRVSDILILDMILASLGVIYFSWHIYAMKKCEPKKPQLSKEEKKRLRIEKIRNMPRAFMRKLFLKEPMTKWNTVNVLIAVDLLFITNFLGYILE